MRHHHIAVLVGHGKKTSIRMGTKESDETDRGQSVVTLKGKNESELISFR